MKSPILSNQKINSEFPKLRREFAYTIILGVAKF